MNAFARVASGLRRAFLSEVQPAAPELLVARPKPMVGLFAGLSAEQKAQALGFRGDHDFGPVSGLAKDDNAR